MTARTGPLFAILALVSLSCSDGGTNVPGDVTSAKDKLVSDVWGDTLVPTDLLETSSPKPDGGEAPDQGESPETEEPEGCQELGVACGTWPTPGGGFVHCGACPSKEYCDAAGHCGLQPDCSVDLFSAIKLDLAGQGDVVKVQPGVGVPMVFGWLLGNRSDCQNCARQIALGFGGAANDDSFICLDLGSVASCPAYDVGYEVGQLVAPTAPGKYSIVAEIPTKLECDAPDYVFGTQTNALQVGWVTVEEPCEPADCEELGVQCGQWDDDCGGQIQCGACGVGKVCSDGGECETADDCTEDVFDVSQVYINGFVNTATVSVGQNAPVLFSWMLGSGKGLDGADRQIVLGVENLPELCVDVGIPETCPAFDTGLGSGTLSAPVNGGTYTVYAVATSEDFCEDALSAYGSSFPRRAIGTLVVEGKCQPATCGSLAAQCGYWDDGCLGVLECGTCSSEEVCGPQGKCTKTPNCQYPVFGLSNVAVGVEGGVDPVVEAGSQVPLALNWQAGNAASCPDCPLQIVLGFESGAAICFNLGASDPCPQIPSGAAGGFITAPGYPGAYVLSAALVQEANCPNAKKAFLEEDRVPIATVLVEGGCIPADCGSLGSDCGDWGDGCGGILHCGICPDGQACNSQGVCESPCVEGIFTVSDVSINGSGKVASASPNMKAQLILAWELGNPDDCPDCERQIVLGVADEPDYCEEAGVPPQCPGTTSGSKSTHVTAPSQAGSYTVFAMAAAQNDCDAAQQVFSSNPFKKPVGTLHVTDGCVPKNCLAMGMNCGDMDDGCGYKLECGQCPPGKLCNDAAKCYCSAQDNYEPNNSPGSAYELGTFSDKDVESSKFIEATMANELDWYHMGALDKPWGYMEPYVAVEFGLSIPYEVTIVYVCMNGQSPAIVDEHESLGCKHVSGLNLSGIPGGTNAYGYICESSGGPVLAHFGPQCDGIDDSGDLYVGIQAGGQCTAYSIDMHL